MTFDIKNSKLYSQIMEALVSFFELEPDTATETDVHAKLDGSETLSKLLEAAATKAVGDLKDQVTALTEKVTGLEKNVSDLTKRAEDAEAKIAAKDNRINELQEEVGAQVKATEDLKLQHKQETTRLSGTIASLRAGKGKETEVDDTTEAAKVGKGKDGAEVIVLQSKTLKALVTPQNSN